MIALGDGFLMALETIRSLQILMEVKFSGRKVDCSAFAKEHQLYSTKEALALCVTPKELPRLLVRVELR